MSRIMFRQKTEEEMQVEANAKQRRVTTAERDDEKLSPAVPVAIEDAPADDALAFALDGETEATKPKKSRKR